MQFLSTIWIFIQDQILGMKWLSSLIGEFLYSIGLDTSGKIGGSVQFFIRVSFRKKELSGYLEHFMELAQTS